MLWTSVKIQSEARPHSKEDISLLCFARISLLYYGIYECFNRLSWRIQFFKVYLCVCVQ